MPAFLGALARLCPVFDGGSVAREVAARADVAIQLNVVSPALALALLRLKLLGELEFQYFDDAEVVEAEGLLGDGRVTHVSRPKVTA